MTRVTAIWRRSCFGKVQPILFLLIGLGTYSSGLSLENNPLRDFSKLRLEKERSPLALTSEDKTSSSNVNSQKDFYYSKEAATESHRVVFKPSYPDHATNSIDYSNRNINRESEAYGPPASHPMIPGPPPMPPQYAQMQSMQQRPQDPSLVNPEDEGEMPPPPSYFSSTEDSSKGNPMMGRRTEGLEGPPISQNGEEPPMPQDVFFVPAPPSQSFLAEIEYDSGTGALLEKGMGGLYDNDSENENPENNEHSDYFDNNNQPELNQNDDGRERKGYGGLVESGGHSNRDGSGFGDYGDY